MLITVIKQLDYARLIEKYNLAILYYEKFENFQDYRTKDLMEIVERYQEDANNYIVYRNKLSKMYPEIYMETPFLNLFKVSENSSAIC